MDEFEHFADDFSNEHRARKRGITISRQGKDGMSAIKRLDAVFANWAAPGMCNPKDHMPTVDGEASQEAIDGDDRSTAQRNHDALNAGWCLRHH